MLRFSPPRGRRIEVADVLDCRIGGAESNVAVAAARLGIDASWMSKVPDSVLGRRVVSALRAQDVEPAVVWSEEGRQGLYFIEPAGPPRGTNVVYDRSHTAVATARPNELDTDLVADAEVFFTTGITPALSERLFETTEALLNHSAFSGFDLNYRGKLWSRAEAKDGYEALLPSVDLLFAPAEDVHGILEVAGSPAEMAETLRTRYDCETVVVTCGADGAVARTATDTIEQSTFEAETFDPIGTGDAFVGGYLARHLRGASVAESLRYAAATAALKRTIDGDLALISEREVESVIDEDASTIDR